ncbi:MAG: nicotinate-nucleotide adenylyltransferase [Ignavibacteria bacterium]|nr:nicotinate-nucleotide adenylyltransferase [Ignavibacteria bacterium]
MKKYGIFGGTFNPPHIAHLILAEWVRVVLALDKIIFIPSGNPPLKRKSDVIDTKHRFNMARLCFGNNRNFLIDDIEIKVKSPKSYTIDTLKKLKEKYKNCDFYLIIGTDNFIKFNKWKNPNGILSLCKVVVINRPPYKFEDGPDEYKRKVKRVKVPELDISSTQIRKLLKNGLSIKYLVPEKVESYIYKNNLYKNK